jgi:hypothetical protein
MSNPSDPISRLKGRRNSPAELWTLARGRSVVLRGVKCALVVGPILIAINHGDVILSGEIESTAYVKMGLTFLVPYAVSVFSSIGAVVAREAAAEDASAPTRG